MQKLLHMKYFHSTLFIVRHEKPEPRWYNFDRNFIYLSKSRNTFSEEEQKNSALKTADCMLPDLTIEKRK
jgi:hypothetical protein